MPRRLIVTRPRAQALPWVKALREYGVDAVALPLIAIEPLADPAPLRAAWAALPRLDWVMFVSANAVERFFAERPAGAAWPQGLRAGSPGPGTRLALQAAGVTAIDEPAPGLADSEGLWAAVAARGWAGRRACVVRGEDGRDWLAEQLRAAGAQVDFVAAYRRAAPRLDDDAERVLAAAVAAPAEHAFAFGSSEVVARLRQLCPAADWSASCALAGHPRIAQAARAAGFGRVHVLPPQEDLAQGAAALAAALAGA
ncbi:MAG: uroporphyrinogen-III synthase [Betaproteobacteria bacterium]|jgi:uroporphyrinogen-III synthase